MVAEATTPMCKYARIEGMPHANNGCVGDDVPNDSSTKYKRGRPPRNWNFGDGEGD
jgi:hypothetical protein